ncbi:phenoloxidase 1-like isoform X2 [Planococcus citri]|uniref:phenoloxidase 1-like isoform X2 n=1 Tax=Planococcus citri TaxID=170843 RepID=UPI0031F90147
MDKIKKDVENSNGEILKNGTGKPNAIFVHINDNETSTNQDPDVYFAKDIGLNWHYRHWYEVNPFLELEQPLFPMNLSRGELFYYEHQQLLARYNFERLCNGLSAVESSQFNITELKLEQGSNETSFADLSKSYEMSFISNLDNTDQKSKGLLDNILQAETALRDPMFYRRCKHMDDSFYQKKKNLNQYTDDIRFEGINISKVEILPQILETFWEKDAINITQKMAPSVFEKIYAVHTHLQHEEFEYKIEVENNFTDNENVSGTVRIFLAPHSEEKIPYEEKRRTFVEMDKFVFNFTGSQTTVITRKSGESTVINGTCGWPRHLLVGKGTEQGFPCDLFVIITKNEKDEIFCMHFDTVVTIDGNFVVFIDPGYICNDGTRIRGHQRCNGKTDCPKNEDELGCNRKLCQTKNPIPQPKLKTIKVRAFQMKTNNLVAENERKIIKIILLVLVLILN